MPRSCQSLLRTRRHMLLLHLVLVLVVDVRIGGAATAALVLHHLIGEYLERRGRRLEEEVI